MYSEIVILIVILIVLALVLFFYSTYWGSIFELTMMTLKKLQNKFLI